MKCALIVVGLGNPGKAYEHTPHNAGFMVIDELAGRCGCSLRRSFRLRAGIGKTLLGGAETWLVKPGAYVNNSGPAVAGVLRKSGAPAENLIVALDDADLEPGRLRIRVGGGDGGHKGLRSIIERVGQKNFVRVRLGIGRDARGTDLAGHVLAPLGPGARGEMQRAAARAADAVVTIIEHGAETAMNRFNAREDRR